MFTRALAVGLLAIPLLSVIVPAQQATASAKAKLAALIAEEWDFELREDPFLAT